jgi:hypothetical protein
MKGFLGTREMYLAFKIKMTPLTALLSIVINHAGEEITRAALAHAEANGYQREAFKAKDSLIGVNKHVEKVKLINGILRLYVT